MSGQLKPLVPNTLVIDAPLHTSISAVTGTRYVDNVDYQYFATTTTGAGELDVDITLVDPESQLYKDLVADGQDPWEPLALSIPDIASADAAGIVEINQTGSFWTRFRYVTTVVEEYEIETVADVAGSLNNTYFILVGVSGISYVYWFNVDGGGTEPTVPGTHTYQEVAISEDDNADTVAAALEAVIDNVFTGSSVSTDTVTVVQTAAGHGSIADGDTGFTFTTTEEADGTLKVIVAGKSI